MVLFGDQAQPTVTPEKKAVKRQLKVVVVAHVIFIPQWIPHQPKNLIAFNIFN